MCGIVVVLSCQGLDASAAQCSSSLPYPNASPPSTSSDEPFPVSSLLQGLTARGPDSQVAVTATISHGGASDEAGPLRGVFVSSLLHLRGSVPCEMPVQDDSGNLLLFNGEIYSGLDIPPGSSDTRALFDALRSCQAPSDIASLLSRLRGPWTLVFLHPATNRIWIGRDVLGRRSLLLKHPSRSDPRLVLTSVGPIQRAGDSKGLGLALPGGTAGGEGPGAPDGEGEGEEGGETDPVALDGFLEVAPGLYSIPLGPTLETGFEGGVAPPAVQLARWPLGEAGRPSRLADIDGDAGPGSADVETSSSLLDRLSSSEELQGGPSTHGGGSAAPPCLTLVRHGWSDPVLDRIEGGERTAGVPGPPSPREAGDSNTDTASALRGRLADDLLSLLDAAVATRCRTIDFSLPSSSSSALDLPPSPVLLLFSGGLDSSLLAALLDRHIDPAYPIDLVNVCFDGGRSTDRLAAVDAMDELARLSPRRTWRLIEVDTSLEEAEGEKDRIVSLLYPAATVMDFNIGAALWLAARGAGTLRCIGPHPQPRPPIGSSDPSASTMIDPPLGSSAPGEFTLRPEDHPWTGLAYVSAARVCVLGHGADELFGGYSRHRTAFRERGMGGLEAELRLDLTRIWKRNLGRDDRLVSDHGREARHPFLDENVVQWALDHAVSDICDLSDKPGTGDKRVLRDALRPLMPRAAARVKRAIHFGSRIGKLFNAKYYGGTKKANKQAGAGEQKIRR